MTGTLWLPTVGTGAQFTIGPGRVVARFDLSRDGYADDAAAALTAVARAIRGIADRAGVTLLDPLCEAERFDEWGGATSRIEVRLYDRQTA